MDGCSCTLERNLHPNLTYSHFSFWGIIPSKTTSPFSCKKGLSIIKVCLECLLFCSGLTNPLWYNPVQEYPILAEVKRRIFYRERKRKGRLYRAVDEERVSLCKERLTGNLYGKIERSAEALRMPHHPNSPLQDNFQPKTVR